MTITAARGYRLALFGAAIFWSLTAGCGRSPSPWPETDRPKVLASMVPLHCFAAKVAGDDAVVRCLLISKGPHEFQPSPQDARLLSQADLLIINGLALETFLESLLQSVDSRQLRLVDTGGAIPSSQLIERPAVQHEGHFHAAGGDPHVWLGVEEAKLQVAKIRDALIDFDPRHESGYRQRAEAFMKQLDQLKTDYADLRDFPGGLVTFHDSFRYFGRSFGIPIVGSVRGLHGEEISPAELRRQVKEFTEKRVRLIGVEPQYANARRVAEELAANLQPPARVVDLDPIETGPPAADVPYYVDPDYYLRAMRRNLDNLRRAKQALQ